MKSTKPSTKEPLIRKKRTLCPICNIERVDLRIHMIRIHGFDNERAAALKSQLNLHKKKKCLPENMRKTKKRSYARRMCPLCSKVSKLFCFLIEIYVTFVSYDP